MFLINLFGLFAAPLLCRNERQNRISPSGGSEHFDLYNTTCGRIIIKWQNNQTEYLLNYDAASRRACFLFTEGPGYHVRLIQTLLNKD